MNVVIATGLSHPDIGGPATYTAFLKRHLPRRGIDCTVVSFREVRKFPRVARHLLFAWRLLRAGKGADVFYALDAVSVGIPTLIASRLLRKKFLLRVPGDYAWEQGRIRWGLTTTLDEYLETRKKPIGVRILSAMQALVARRATHVVVPSEYLRGVVLKWGVPDSRITRVYSELSPIRISEDASALRARFGFRDWTVTTAGRLVPWKGVEAVIDAVIGLRLEGVPVSLCVMGDGELRGALHERVRARTAEDIIHFCGTVEREELWARIAASDVFILNSSYEGLSHQLLEVMDIGTPIITTACGGNRELCTNEREGLIVGYNSVEEIREAILRIRDDKPLARGLSTEAKRRVAGFSEDVIVAETVALLSTI